MLGFQSLARQDSVLPPTTMPEANESRTEATAQELFERFYEPIRVFFIRRGFTSEQAKDLAQETLLRAFRRIDSLRDPSSARPWIFSVAANVFRNELRLRRTAKRQSIEESLESLETAQDIAEGHVTRAPVWPGTRSDPGVVNELLAQERREQLAAAMRALPPRMRRAIFLRVGQGLKYREIASVMQVSIETVKSLLNAARVRLQSHLSQKSADVPSD